MNVPIQTTVHTATIYGNIIYMFDCFKICNLKIFVIRITFTMTR